MNNDLRVIPTRGTPRLSAWCSPAPVPRALALPASANAFRLLGGGDDLQWIGDDMGGAVDPDGPKPTRRDFLVRVAVAAGALTAGGALNALATILAGRSEVAQATGAPSGGRR